MFIQRHKKCENTYFLKVTYDEAFIRDLYCLEPVCHWTCRGVNVQTWGCSLAFHHFTTGGEELFAPLATPSALCARSSLRRKRSMSKPVGYVTKKIDAIFLANSTSVCAPINATHAHGWTHLISKQSVASPLFGSFWSGPNFDPQWPLQYEHALRWRHARRLTSELLTRTCVTHGRCVSRFAGRKMQASGWKAPFFSSHIFMKINIKYSCYSSF